jgi:hypothetical protein
MTAGRILENKMDVEPYLAKYKVFKKHKTGNCKYTLGVALRRGT